MRPVEENRVADDGDEADGDGGSNGRELDVVLQALRGGRSLLNCEANDEAQVEDCLGQGQGPAEHCVGEGGAHLAARVAFAPEDIRQVVAYEVVGGEATEPQEVP